MFESLSSKLNDVFQRLGNKGRLTEKDIENALKEALDNFVKTQTW